MLIARLRAADLSARHSRGRHSHLLRMDPSALDSDVQRCGRCKAMVPIVDYSPSYRGKVGTWCRPCFAAYNRGDKSTVGEHAPLECSWCKQSYIPKQLRPGAAFCSRKCKDGANYASVAAEILASKSERSCLHCAAVIPQAARRDKVFCSEQCNSRAHALQRKLRARTGQDDKPGYLRSAICERDDWRCWICKKFVDRHADHPDPLAPSLDHLIPVSRGGVSELSNLRLTHLVCNLRRRNLPAEAAIGWVTKRERVTI